MTRRLLLPLLLLAGACGNSTGLGSPPLLPGTYALVSIGGRPLPTAEPCSGVRTEEARIVVREGRAIEYSYRGTRPATGEAVTASATGSYTTDFDGSVRLSLSYAATPGSTLSPQLQRTADGLEEIVGMPCDGRDVKLYRHQP